MEPVPTPVPEGYRTLLDVDVLSDPAVQKRLVTPSLALLGVCAAGIVAIVVGCGLPRDPVMWALLVIAAYGASLPVHELVHAAVFKLLGRPGLKVRFGFASGMLYAGCPGEVFGRRAFVAVLLAPFAVLSAVYAAACGVLGDLLGFWALFWLHASGCVGDFLFAWAILRHPEAAACQDTSAGMRLLVRDEGEDAYSTVP